MPAPSDLSDLLIMVNAGIPSLIYLDLKNKNGVNRHKDSPEELFLNTVRTKAISVEVQRKFLLQFLRTLMTGGTLSLPFGRNFADLVPVRRELWFNFPSEYRARYPLVYIPLFLHYLGVEEAYWMQLGSGDHAGCVHYWSDSKACSVP